MGKKNRQSPNVYKCSMKHNAYNPLGLNCIFDDLNISCKDQTLLWKMSRLNLKHPEILEKHWSLYEAFSMLIF